LELGTQNLRDARQHAVSVQRVGVGEVVDGEVERRAGGEGDGVEPPTLTDLASALQIGNGGTTGIFSRCGFVSRMIGTRVCGMRRDSVGVMKTKNRILMAALAAFTLSSTGFAMQQADNARATFADDGKPMALRLARFPFRVAHSVVRTPRIMVETIDGKRAFISDRGLLQTNDRTNTERWRDPMY